MGKWKRKAFMRVYMLRDRQTRDWVSSRSRDMWRRKSGAQLTRRYHHLSDRLELVELELRELRVVD